MYSVYMKADKRHPFLPLPDSGISENKEVERFLF